MSRENIRKNPLTLRMRLFQADTILVAACRSLACRSLVNRALFSLVKVTDAATIKWLLEDFCSL